jgi:PAS domain S-box-containing protein
MQLSKSYHWTRAVWPSSALFAFGCIVLALLTFVCLRLRTTDAVAGLLYLVVVVVMSLPGRVVPSLLISIIALGCLDFFFTPPLFQFTLVDPLDAAALVAFLTTALVITTLMSRVRKSFQEIRTLRDQLRLIVDTIPGLIWSASPDGAVDFTNQRWMEYTGRSLVDAKGWAWTSAVYPDDIGMVNEWRKVLTAGLPFETEFRLRRADGEYRWFLTRALPLTDESGNIEKWYCTGIEIEDRKRAEEAVRTTHAELAHVTRVLTMGELTASIAHEINQPLAAIVINGNACLRWLAGDSPNLDEAREAATRIVREGKRTSDIVKRLRALSKKTGSEKKEPLDLNDAIQEMVDLAQGEIKKSGVVLRVELETDLPQVLGDRVQLQQVVLNLMMNGIDAMKTVTDRTRSLVIKTESVEPDQVRATLQDSGTGLDPKSVERIFDAFYTTKSGGMGMGLSISRSIVENHGGRLRAIPNDGPGTSLEFTLLRYV